MAFWRPGLRDPLYHAGDSIARFAERFHRVWIIAIAVFIWSLMTALCGVATSFLVLFLFRVGVSVGEAGCTPPAQSLIADYFVPKSRATAVSIYALGVPLGGMFAAVFAGFIVGNLDGLSLAVFFTAELELGTWPHGLGMVEGWRVAFILVGIPGIVLAFVEATIQSAARLHRSAKCSGARKGEHEGRSRSCLKADLAHRGGPRSLPSSVTAWRSSPHPSWCVRMVSV